MSRESITASLLPLFPADAALLAATAPGARPITLLPPAGLAAGAVTGAVVKGTEETDSGSGAGGGKTVASNFSSRLLAFFFPLELRLVSEAAVFIGVVGLTVSTLTALALALLLTGTAEGTAGTGK